MRRRTFLASISATAGVFAPSTPFALGDPSQKTDTVLIISDIGAATSLAGLEAVLQALITAHVPCLCVIDPAIASAAPLMPDDPRAILLRRVWIDYPGLIELAPFVADLEIQRPYFQARLASLALIQLSETLDIAGSIRAGRKISTIACFGTLKRLSLDGLRSAGVRTVMAMPEEGTLGLRNRISPSNVLTVSGGRRVSFFDAPEQLLNMAEHESHNVLVFSATEFARTDSQSLAAAAARFAHAAAERNLQGRGVLTQPCDILIRDGTEFRRKVAVHLFDAANDEVQARLVVSEFAEKLKKAGIAYSISARHSDGMDAASLGFWIAETGQATPIELPYAPNGKDPRPGQMLILGRTNATWRGLDIVGNLHLPISFEVSGPLREGALSRAVGAVDDGVVLIDAAAVGTQAQQMSVIRALKQLVQDGVTDTMSLGDLVMAIMPPDPLLPVLKQTDAASPAFVHLNGRAADIDRDVLMEDARIAWTYFDTFTNKSTGLCQAAISGFDSAESQYERLTMWDIGSHINALRAAVDLKLIERDEFRARAKKVLRHLSGRKIKGSVLPPEEVFVATGRTTRNFNASDTGRLLAALARLARHPFGDRKRVEALVASWDLKDVVKEGKLHSIIKGQLVSAANSQYTDYSVRGFAAWRVPTHSPYAGFNERGSADEKMAFLATLAQLGPFGAEPVLLKLLEHGPDSANAYVADILFSAIFKEYDRGGHLLCPSETPIDRSPWFIYQGLQVASPERPWRVVFNKDGESIEIYPDRDAMAVSSKAAYLWAAAIDHPHSARLLRYVREKARDKLGFASCIYVESQSATSGSSDINTNAIILQSISAMLIGQD